MTPISISGGNACNCQKNDAFFASGSSTELEELRLSALGGIGYARVQNLGGNGIIFVAMAMPGLGDGDPAPENRERAMALVKQAGQILYPPSDGGGPAAFDPTAVFDDVERYRQSIVKYTEALELWPDCVDALVGRSSSHSFWRT